MTYALKFAKAAPAIAMSYLSVVWGLLGGYFFFNEVRYDCFLGLCHDFLHKPYASADTPYLLFQSFQSFQEDTSLVMDVIHGCLDQP